MRLKPDPLTWKCSFGYCLLCGHDVMVTQSPEPGMDYHWYCANRLCSGHMGEDTGDQEVPMFLERGQ